MKRFLPLLCAVALLAACSRGDDAAEAPPERVTDKFASNHFLQYLNPQPSLAAGYYAYKVRAAAGTVSFTVQFTLDDGTPTTPVITGSADTSGVISVNDAGGPRLRRAGGLVARMTSSGPACLYLLDGPFLGRPVLFRDGDADPSDDDCDTGETAPALDVPASKTNDASYAAAYYATIDPAGTRDTLEEFKAVNGFGAGDRHVIFRDTKDLGYGRDMYFHDNGDGTYAFYVNNFAITDLPGVNYGPLNLDAAIAQVKKYHIGTNAIEYGPIDADGVGGFDDINDDGTIDAADYFPRFYNFSSAPPYERRDTVDLDGKGEKAMPVPCIVCHGGRADALLPDGSFPRSGDTFSQLQPLDVGTFEYGAASPWTRAEVEVGLKAINTAVYDSYAALETPPLGQWDSSMAREMLEAWYGGPGLPSAFDDTYIPDGWQPDPNDGSPPAGADGLYRDMLSTNCRTCHLLRGNQHQSDIDFTSWDKFIGYDDRIEELVFDAGLMPLATLTFGEFHEDTFLPEMLASFLPNFSHYDAGGELLLPGRPVANAGPDRRSPTGVSVWGTASQFADSYAWTIVSQPTGANPSLVDANTFSAALYNAIDGVYVLQLIVSSGSVQSDPDTVTVTVDSSMSPAPFDLTFATHIEPVLTSAGCTGCHTDGGNPRPPVFYTPGPNRDVYDTVRSLVNFDDPLNSRLLLKPSGHHHAGGTLTGFDLAGNRDNYDLFLDWILEGAREN
jgi:mono/diheme cytochrome c family protein